MSEIERKQKIYQELIEEARRTSPGKLPNEFTVKEFAKDGGFSIDKARKFLRKMVAEGKLKERRTNRGLYYSVV